MSEGAVGWRETKGGGHSLIPLGFIERGGRKSHGSGVLAWREEDKTIKSSCSPSPGRISQKWMEYFWWEGRGGESLIRYETTKQKRWGFGVRLKPMGYNWEQLNNWEGCQVQKAHIDEIIAMESGGKRPEVLLSS